MSKTTNQSLAKEGMDRLKFAVLTELEKGPSAANEIRWSLFPQGGPVDDASYHAHYVVLHVLHLCLKDGSVKRLNAKKWALPG